MAVNLASLVLSALPAKDDWDWFLWSADLIPYDNRGGNSRFPPSNGSFVHQEAVKLSIMQLII